MRQGTPGFEREDALVCADVLGGLGVSSDHVRERVAAATGGDGVDDLETAIQRALADPEHPTAFVRRTVAAAPRGVDSPARFWTTAPETQLGDVFAAIDWTFDVKSANGRSLSVEDAQPYRLRVEDGDGRTRSCEFSFPDTPLGDDNYPALVHAINEHLLYGLDCRFVQLSDGTDRWRFALVETDEYERIVDRFGERVTAFDRPLLAADQPTAYAPDDDGAAAADETAVEPAADDPTEDDPAPNGDAVARTADGVPVPAWARESRDRSWRGRRLTADAFDADHVGGLDHLDDDSNSDVADAESGSDAADAAAAIEFVDAPTTDQSDTVGSASDVDGATNGADASRSDAAGVDADGRTVVRDAESSVREAEASTQDAESSVREAASSTDEGAASASKDEDLAGWSIGGSVDATTRSSASTDGPGSPSVEENGSGSPSDATASGADASTSSEGASEGFSTSGFTWGDENADATTSAGTASDGKTSAIEDGTTGSEDEETAGEDEPTTSEEDEFFSADATASFDAGAKTSRVGGDSFGVDAGEQTADDQFAAVGAALAAPAGISCSGLLDDDEFLPHLPRSEPEETRLSFDEEFDPTGDPADERETSDGFVWVNESKGLDENRTSASD
jgi:hypothetical protein